MKLEWLGKHRYFVEQFVLARNAYARAFNIERDMGTSVKFTCIEIQILEYIIENEDDNESMVSIANRLGITPGTFSRIAAKLVDKGVLKRYHLENNRKNIILGVSEEGHKIYEEYTAYTYKVLYKDILDILDTLPEDSIEKFCQILALSAEFQKSSLEEERNLERKALRKTEIKKI